MKQKSDPQNARDSSPRLDFGKGLEDSAVAQKHRRDHAQSCDKRYKPLLAFLSCPAKLFPAHRKSHSPAVSGGMFFGISNHELNSIGGERTSETGKA